MARHPKLTFWKSTSGKRLTLLIPASRGGFCNAGLTIFVERNHGIVKYRSCCMTCTGSSVEECHLQGGFAPKCRSRFLPSFGPIRPRATSLSCIIFMAVVWHKSHIPEIFGNPIRWAPSCVESPRNSRGAPSPHCPSGPPECAPHRSCELVTLSVYRCFYRSCKVVDR